MQQPPLVLAVAPPREAACPRSARPSISTLIPETSRIDCIANCIRASTPVGMIAGGFGVSTEPHRALASCDAARVSGLTVVASVGAVSDRYAFPLLSISKYVRAFGDVDFNSIGIDPRRSHWHVP